MASRPLTTTAQLRALAAAQEKQASSLTNLPLLRKQLQLLASEVGAPVVPVDPQETLQTEAVKQAATSAATDPEVVDAVLSLLGVQSEEK